MPRPKIAKTTPTAAEPHTIEIPTIEAWTNVTSQPPYTFIRGRTLTQYILALMLQEIHKKGKRYVRIYFPLDVLSVAYQHNPAAFAATIRTQNNCPFQFVTVRCEYANGRVRLTASEIVQQKASNYLGTCSALMQAEYAKNPDAGFSLVFLYKDMPKSYQNDHRVFKFRVRRCLQQATGNNNLELAIQVLEDGYRLSKIPVGM